nr:MAG TPA: hypothetical protein [Caudoviricetes sp.]
MREVKLPVKMSSSSLFSPKRRLLPKIQLL